MGWGVVIIVKIVECIACITLLKVVFGIVGCGNGCRFGCHNFNTTQLLSVVTV